MKEEVCSGRDRSVVGYILLNIWGSSWTETSVPLQEYLPNSIWRVEGFIFTILWDTVLYKCSDLGLQFSLVPWILGAASRIIRYGMVFFLGLLWEFGSDHLCDLSWWAAWEIFFSKAGENPWYQGLQIQTISIWRIA